MRRATIAGCLGLLLSACAGSSQPSLDQAAMQRSESAAAARPFRDVTLPPVRVGEAANGLTVTLSARIDRQSAPVRPFLRADLVYAAARQRTYDTARDDAGAQLKSERLGANERCRPDKSCTYDEAWLIELPEPALRQAKTTGYRVKLFARSGPEIEIGIPGPQIASLFEKADAGSAPATAQAPRPAPR